jgi:hypothetical protein
MTTSQAAIVRRTAKLGSRYGVPLSLGFPNGSWAAV